MFFEILFAYLWIIFEYIFAIYFHGHKKLFLLSTEDFFRFDLWTPYTQRILKRFSEFVDANVQKFKENLFCILALHSNFEMCIISFPLVDWSVYYLLHCIVSRPQYFDYIYFGSL